ncbi:MAG TPA: hypothetical protein VM840_12395, partial [Actinomycetota bacterium]|nr:hypothetical protein [Actinomycetota bacterium]
PGTGPQGRCQDHPTPDQTYALTVRSRETVLLILDADRAPNQETIRPFQGSDRRAHQPQPVQPALETSLTVDLPAGEWNLDLCATWTGYGQPCWLFRLNVVE